MLPDNPPQPDRQPTLIDPARALTQHLGDEGDAAVAATGRDDDFKDDPQDVIGGTVLVDRYELLSVVGTGAMAQVWLAHDHLLGRSVAVKRLLPQWRAHPDIGERFRREGTMTARLRHPTIVGVLDAGVDADGAAFQVLELVEGRSLADRLEEGGRLSSHAVVDLGRGILGGLGHAHDAGLIHRDVKPGNILLEDPQSGPLTPRLTDFGAAKLADQELDLTAHGIVVGTAAYLAPEQASGDPVDHRADLYALGCVLFECLTGERPFAGGSPVQVASARIGVQVRASDRMPEVPDLLDAVIARAMAPLPADRFATAQEMADALEAARGDLGQAPGPAAASAPPAPPLPPPPAPPEPVDRAAATVPPSPRAAPASGQSRRLRVGREVAWLVGAGLLAILIVAVIALTRGPDDEPTVSDAAAPAEVGDAPLAIAGVTPFDPQGDGGEHSEDLLLLVDGDPGTAWTTEGYSSADFGNLKPGVGAIIDLGEPRALQEALVLGITAGTNVEVRVATTSPTSLEETALVGASQGGPDATVLLGDAGPVQYILVWIVPPLPSDGSRFRGGIGEVQLVS